MTVTPNEATVLGVYGPDETGLHYDIIRGRVTGLNHTQLTVAINMLHARYYLSRVKLHRDLYFDITPRGRDALNNHWKNNGR